MIVKPGRIEITNQDVIVHEFHFEGVNLPTAEIEALEWAKARLDTELSHARSVLTPKETE